MFLLSTSELLRAAAQAPLVLHGGAVTSSRVNDVIMMTSSFVANFWFNSTLSRSGGLKWWMSLCFTYGRSAFDQWQQLGLAAPPPPLKLQRATTSQCWQYQPREARTLTQAASYEGTSGCQRRKCWNISLATKTAVETPIQPWPFMGDLGLVTLSHFIGLWGRSYMHHPELRGEAI